MTLDILGALESMEFAKTGLRCRIGRWLDDIPDDQPGKVELVATLTETDQTSEHWRPIDQLDALLLHLGLHSSGKTIGDHRAGRCRCPK